MPVSVITGLEQITPTLLEKLIREPSLVKSVIFPSEGPNEQGVDRGIDVDKAWQGIHFLLTGKARGGRGPLAYALEGCREFGREIGDLPAMYLTAEDVRAVAQALAPITNEEMRQRLDLKAMKKKRIYLFEQWDNLGEAIDYLLGHYERMANYYSDAAAKGNAMLVYTL